MKRGRRCAYVFGLLYVLAAVSFPAAAQDFQRSIVSTQVPGAYDVAVADFDNDGDLDVAATGSETGSVWWMENVWPGFNTYAVLITGSSRPRGITAGDFDGDSDADIIFAAYGENRFVLLENLGTGTVNRFRAWTLRDSSLGAWSVNAGDVDGDGDLDLVVTEFLGASVRILTRTDSVWTERAFAVSYPLDAVFADFDSDGDTDVVGSANYSEMFWIEQTNPDVWALQTLGFGTYASAVVVGDLDGDGDRDVAASLYSSDVIAWWARTPSGFVGDTLPWTVELPRDLVAADFDVDGRLDLAACSQAGTMAWFQQTDSGFTAHPMSGGTSFRAMTVTDFDRDGDPDLITADYGGAEITIYSNRMGIPAVVEGTVYAEHDGSPVAGISVSLVETGTIAQTDAAGFYRLVAAPGTYMMVAQAPCWNETSVPELALVPGDTITQNISLTRPLLNLSATSINVTTNNHVPMEVVLPLSNAGDGPLHVTAAVRGNSANDPWLAIHPSAVDILPEGNAVFTVEIAPDTLDTGAWDYYGDIMLRSNACPDSVRHIAVIAYVLDAPSRSENLPKRTALLPLYPNPFNGLARARLALAKDCEVDLKIMDVLGRETMRVFHGRLNAGEQTIDVNANGLASGVYVLMLRAGTETFTQKMLLIR